MTERKHPHLTDVADALSLIRIAAALPIAYKLHKTTPENRSWKFAAAVGLVAVTDKVDGWLARKSGPTKRGGRWDELADKALMLPSLWVLGNNGEISRWYFRLQATRDIGMTIIREVAGHQNIDTSSRELGQLKTTTGLTSLTFAASRQAARRPLLEIGMAINTGLSLVSGIDNAVSYGVNYFNGNPQPSEVGNES